MGTEVIWSKVKKLEGKDVTTIQGKKFHIYRVTDSDVYYDPLSTKSPGTHWSYRSTITELAKAIPTMKNRPRVWRLSNISELCEELSIKGEEQTPSYEQTKQTSRGRQLRKQGTIISRQPTPERLVSTLFQGVQQGNGYDFA